MVSKEVENGKVCAFLAYLLVGIIWYFADEKMKKNSFAKFHVKQGLALLVAWVIVGIASIILAFIPILGRLIILIADIALLIFFIMGIIYALSGKEKELPIIGGFAKMFTF